MVLRPPWLLLAVLAAGCSGSRGHDQQAGRYAFTATQTLEDSCGLIPVDGLWDGDLVRSGDWVRVDYDLFDMFLVGYYRYDLEEFYLDGTATNVDTGVGGTACHLDQVRVHVEATTITPDRFDGTLALTYDTRDGDVCRCTLRVAYQADREGQ